MLNEKDGLFKRDDKLIFAPDGRRSEASKKILCDSFNKNEEVAGLLKHVGGDILNKDSCSIVDYDYSTRFIFGMLCLTKVLLNNLLVCVDLQFKKEGMIRKTILNGIPFGGETKNRIDKLPFDTTAKDIFSCFRARDNSVRGIRFHSNSKSKYDPYGGIYINYRKIDSVLCVFEKVGSDDCSLKIIQNAINEIDEVLETMLSNQCVGIVWLTVPTEFKEAAAMEDNTQTLTLNRPKQQENKIITVGNKTAYQVGPGDWKHRNGRIIEGEKKEMNNVCTYPVYDKNILADLEDLLNSVIDNPDVVDKIVDYLAENSPAAHFISEMIGCGEISDEESLRDKLYRAAFLSQRIFKDGKNANVLDCERRVFSYLNVDYPKPIFGKELFLKQVSFCLDVAAREIEDILNSAEEEAEEEKEEVIADVKDDVQEHAEEDCEPHTQDIQDYDDLDFEELAKLMEERQKKEAELDAELAQAEEEKRKELIAGLRAADKRIEGKEARLAKLREK